MIAAHGLGLGCAGLGDHLFEGHSTTREIANRLHVVQWHTVLLPLRDRSRRNVEVVCKRRGAALLGFEPCGEVHGS